MNPASAPIELQPLLERFGNDVTRLMASLQNGMITADEWYANMRRLLARYHVEAMKVGTGLTALPEGADDLLVKALDFQDEYLDNFRMVIEAAPEFNEAWVSRALMYVKSIQIPYWEGEVYRQAGRFLPIPFVPGQGTQCMCITTPNSLIITHRGQIPICDVRVGDLVLTHKLRWRRVARTFVNRSVSGHRQAWIMSPYGYWVGCTADHKWLTSGGWRSSISIYNSNDPVYNCSHENLRKMQHTIREQKQGKPLHHMSPHVFLSMRQEKGLQSNKVPVLCQQREGEDPMEKQLSSLSQWVEEVWNGEEDEIIGYKRDYQLVSERGRPFLSLLLERGRENKEIHLPLSMGMDKNKRNNSERLSHTSQEWRQARRQNRELGITNEVEAFVPTYDRRTETQNGKWTEPEVYGQNKAWGENDLGLLGLWEGVSQIPQEWSYRPEILLNEMLQCGTLLYDIEVEDDHSFIVDGLISHNSNDRCTVKITTIDADKGDFLMEWLLDPNVQDHCQTCLERAAMSPYAIKGGVLQI